MEFIGLDDTPASYAAQGRKTARVNLAEDAIEFGPGFDTPINPTIESTLIYGPAAPPGAWTDLDVGVGHCLAYIRMSGDCTLQFRRKGEVFDWEQGCGRMRAVVAEPYAYVVVLTDSAGLVQWKLAAGAGNVTLWRIAYWPEPPVPDIEIATGINAPIVFTQLNTGIPNALVLLHFSSGVAIPKNFMVQEYGETNDMDTASGIAGCTCGATPATYDGHVMMLTDSLGRLQWKVWFTPNVDYIIRLVAYIPCIVNQPKLLLYSGVNNSSATYQDIPTPFGRGFMLLKGLHTGGAATAVAFRENGAAQGAYHGGPGVTCLELGAGFLSYVLVPLDTYGVAEWGDASGVGTTVDLTAVAISGG